MTAFNAFLSYSRDDAKVAAMLQRRLERYGSSRLFRRKVRVFRDQTNLRSDGSLTDALFDAMGRSDWFILLASESSAGSAWVTQELRWWISNRKHEEGSLDRILIVRAGGIIEWPAGAEDFDWSRTTALSGDVFEGLFPSPWLWKSIFRQDSPGRGKVDPDAIASLAATIRGENKDALERRHQRIRTATISAIVVIAVLVAALGIYVVRQRQTVRDEQVQRAAATLTALATDSRTDSSLAALLALEAHHLDPSANTVSAMVELAQRNGPTVRTFSADASGIADLVTDTDGTAFVAGRDGGVTVWNLQRGELLGEYKTDQAIIKLAFDDEQDLLTGIDRSGTAWLWSRNDDNRLAELERLSSSAPTADFAAVGFGFMSSGARVFAADSSGRIIVWDITTGTVLSDASLATYRSTDGHDLSGVSIRSGSPVSSTFVQGTTFLLVTDQSDVLLVDADHATVGVAVRNSDLPASATVAATVPDTDSKVIVVGTTEGAVLWDRRRHSRIAYPLGGVTDAITSVAASGNGTVLALGSKAGTALVPLRNQSVVRYLIDTGDPMPVPPALPRAEPVGRSAAILAFGNFTSALAVAHGDGTVSLLDVDNRRLSYQAARGSAVVAFDPRGNLLLGDKTTGGGGVSVVRVVRPGAAKPIEAYAGESYEAWFDIVYQGWVYESVVEYAMPVTSGGYRQSLVLTGAAVGEDWVAAAGQVSKGRSAVLVWRVDDPVPTYLTVAGMTAVDALGGSASARMVVARGASEIAGWSIDSVEPKFVISVGAGSGLSVSQRGTLAVTTVTAATPGCGSALAGRRSLVVVDLASGASCTYDVGPGLTAAAVSADASQVATANANGLVLRDSKDMTVVRSIPLDLGGGQTQLAFSPDGKRLAASLADGRILIVDTGTGTLALPPLIDPIGRASGAIAWSPDGQTLAALAASTDRAESSVDFHTNLWRVGTISWNTQMCSLAGRRLTADEWKTYVPAEAGLEYTPVCESFE
ncbi:toll/interleukin-1 receptor domain-containing protein [Catellatospora tritici]|uniref:toll/interleukin-1 receptor domain-containing protein n=1 Tax=Catellatospora tritici TaxID=2851566 RepID=UPI001C2D0DAF|nr:TIR domain-containing protein [Catellatospora tritici]MBV1855721.1 TIR domain-containing protein [Catellatospora tritici]